MRRPLPPVLAVRPGERPTIVCPDWCVDEYDDHLNELGELEGFVIHHSADGLVSHTRSAYPDNSVDPDDPPIIQVDATDGLSVEQAKELVHALLRAIEEAGR